MGSPSWGLPGLPALLVIGAAAFPGRTFAAKLEPAAITVDTQSISRSELEAGVQLELALTRFHAAPSEADRAVLRERVAARLGDLLLLDALGRARAIPLDETRVEARLAAAARSYGGLGGLEKLLGRAGMSLSLYRRQLGFQVRGEALVASVAKKSGPITPAAIEQHFKSNRARYQLPASFHVVVALLKLDPGRLSEPGYRDTLEATANNLAEKLRAGQSLASLSAEHADAEIKDLGFAHAGALVPEIAKAAEGLEVGAVSAPVKALRGYYVVKLVAKKPPEPLPFAKVRGAIAAELRTARKATLRVRLLAEARKTFGVTRVPPENLKTAKSRKNEGQL